MRTIRFYAPAVAALAIASFNMSCSAPDRPLDKPKEESIHEPNNEAASQSKGTPEHKTIRAMTGNASLTARGSVTDDGRSILVSGTTNLPDGTSLMISVSSKALNIGDTGEVTVKNGAYSSGPLVPSPGPMRDKTVALVPGKYLISVTMPLPPFQSADVRLAIGQNGEHLKGPLVTNSSIGRTLEFEGSFTMGTKDARQKAIKANLEVVGPVVARARALLLQGRELERLRNASDVSRRRQCLMKMHQLQASAKELQNSAEKLPGNFGLKVAATELNWCVSCTSTALEACQRADAALRGE